VHRYDHHIGDYDAATAHLSWDEDQAYTRMIRVYYRTEKPLPADVAQVCRLVRASLPKHRQAVQAVLEEFFTLEEDGWHNKRCDEEIAKTVESGEEHELKRTHERERQRRQRQRRKELFAALREHGIVPKYDTSIEELQTLLSRERERDGNAPVTRDERDRPRLSFPLSPSPFPLPPENSALPEPPPPAPTPYGAASVLLRAHGVAVGSQDPFLIAWVDEVKATDDQLVAAVERARHHKPKPENIPAKYLDPIVREVCAQKRPRSARSAPEQDFSKLDYSKGF
jgi:uncharacterized protein YdaU (DUF1376 family)